MKKAFLLLAQVIDLVELMPSDEITLPNVADSVGYSRWQLQRTFTAWVGMSLSAYLSDVKLSRAAQRLLTESSGVLTIALDAGFGSQEAFTRAFQKRFQMTPGQYRKRGQPTDISLALIIPENKTWSRAMNIKLEHKPAMHLSGMMDYFNGHGMEGANNFEVIPPLWAKVNQEARQQDSTIEPWYGLIYESDQPKRGQLRYLASHNLADGNVTFSNPTTQTVEAALYAIVPHYGRLSDIGDTLDAFYGQWLPESGYKMASNVNIEVYDHRFDPVSEESYFETWVPVVKVSG